MADASGPAVRRIAVVGSGPRGLMVVERLVARLADERTGKPVRIDLIDAIEVGSGRVYRTDQPQWFLMNTVAGMVSAFSGVPDEGPARPGAGPSLLEWWRAVDPDHADPDGYASRADYGRYMHFVLNAVLAWLPQGTELNLVSARVDDLERVGHEYRLALSTGETLTADRVVLTTGHSVPALTGEEKTLAEFAAGRPGLRYVRGDSAADMPLSEILPGTPVGILGLGLSFYDVMAAFTIGRGGRFVGHAGGRLEYVPSGQEPVLVAGSRSGMPLPARGRNQKPPGYSYRPLLFTRDNIRRRGGDGPLDFRIDMLPWLMAEVDLVYYATELRRRDGATVAEAFTAEVVSAASEHPPDLRAIATRYGLDRPRLDLDELARPFEHRSFADRQEFDQALRAAIADDLQHAMLGNVDSPLKAALDVLRDCRGLIMKLVDFSGLTPASHRTDFIGWYAPRSAFLAAGPPEVRLRQVLALLGSGTLRIIGPHARFAPDEDSGRFLVSSPRVGGAAMAVDVVIDARIPEPDLHRDTSPLTRRLRERGIWTGYTNGTGPEAYHTGGVAVTTSPYHPLDRDGRPDTGLYVVGIPTEYTRWFMQVGSSRPGLWGDFVHDADAIAAHALKEGS